MPLSLALFQPDIPQNAGAVLRLCACFDTDLHIIAPCGFLWDDRRMQRAGMDYRTRVTRHHHADWTRFRLWQQEQKRRLVLMTTKGATSLSAFSFTTDDIILMGRESSGVPPEVDQAAEARIRIPMRAGERSLNVAQSAAIAVWEAVRQTGGTGL